MFTSKLMTSIFLIHKLVLLRFRRISNKKILPVIILKYIRGIHKFKKKKTLKEKKKGLIAGKSVIYTKN